MKLTALDRRILAGAAEGLDLVPAPFEELGKALGLDTSTVIDRLGSLRDRGAIKRLGLVVRHHELGFRSNAMVVWDIPDDQVDALGERMARYSFVTLCYRRRRSPPRWPYSLFAMIHGKERQVVVDQIDRLNQDLGLRDRAQSVLFSRTRFKQRGARYETRTGAAWTSSTAAS